MSKGVVVLLWAILSPLPTLGPAGYRARPGLARASRGEVWLSDLGGVERAARRGPLSRRCTRGEAPLVRSAGIGPPNIRRSGDFALLDRKWARRRNGARRISGSAGGPRRSVRA